MTAAELARTLNARRIGRGKWMALCPAHPDRKPSLSIAEGRRVPVVLKCMSMGCDTRDILKAAGLAWGDLFEGKPTPAIRRKVSLQDAKEALERRWILCEMLSFLEPESRSYWLRAAQRHQRELFWVRWELEPDRVEQETLKIVKRLRDERASSAARTGTDGDTFTPFG